MFNICQFFLLPFFPRSWSFAIFLITRVGPDKTVIILLCTVIKQQTFLGWPQCWCNVVLKEMFFSICPSDTGITVEQLQRFLSQFYKQSFVTKSMGSLTHSCSYGPIFHIVFFIEFGSFLLEEQSLVVSQKREGCSEKENNMHCGN